MSTNHFLQVFDQDLTRFNGTGTGARDYEVKLLAIRGYFGDMGIAGVNDLGIYDDLIVRIVGDEVTEYRASTDPGWAYITHPENAKGCAILAEATHFFKIGTHQHGKYMALVQAEDFLVYRLDKLGRIQGKSIITDGSLHLHSGGSSEEVGVYSAGCQIIHSPEGYFGATWHHFYDPLVAAMKVNGQTVVPYKLLSGADFLKLIK